MLIFSVLPSQLQNFQLLCDYSIRSSLTSIAVGEQVVVIPAGLRAVVVSHATGLLDELKKSITDRLAQQGLWFAKALVWLHLRLLKDGNLFMWPADLCLWKTRTPKDTEKANTIASIVSDDPYADPLARAEDWYARRLDRAGALATIQKNEEIASRLTRQDNNMEIDDVFPLESSHLNSRGNVQDVTGVYPTPPDGPPPHPYSSTAVPQLATHASSENTTAVATNAPSTSPRICSPGSDYESVKYRDNGTESLFEDMDADLFASNGLTEADFNFFDEPSLDDIADPEMDHDSYSMAADPPILETGIAEPDVISVDQSAKNSDAASDISMDDIEAEVAEAEDYGSPMGSSLVVRRPEAENPPTVKPPDGPIALDREFRHELSGLSRMPQQSSYNRVLFKSSLDDFDAKYAEQGRFPSKRTDQIEGEEPTTRMPQRRYPIPRIGQLQESTKINFDDKAESVDVAEGM